MHAFAVDTQVRLEVIFIFFSKAKDLSKTSSRPNLFPKKYEDTLCLFPALMFTEMVHRLEGVINST